MQAKDVMTANVVSVTEDAPVHEIVGLLLKHRISAVPVVDGANKVVGIVSEGDLLRPEGTSRTGSEPPWWLEAVFSGRKLEYTKDAGRTARGVMTSDVIIADEDMPLNQIAELLERNHIKRLPVVRDGKLVGIVSRANLLHGLANTIIAHHEPNAEKDRKLRNELIGALLSHHELAPQLINVTVSEGKVRLWGKVDNSEQATLAERTAKAVKGVGSVENNLLYNTMPAVPV